MQKKIDKRGRKLVDYDSQRHSFQNLQANAAKRKDDVKLTKGRESLEEAKRTYELLNTELHDELPALYDSRILFLVTNLQTLFASEQMFHNETSKIYAELEAIVDKLATESQRGSYTLKKLNCKLCKDLPAVIDKLSSFCAYFLATSNNVQTPVKSIEISNPISYPPITNGNSAAANGGKRNAKQFSIKVPIIFHHFVFFIVAKFSLVFSSHLFFFVFLLVVNWRSFESFYFSLMELLMTDSY